MTRTSEAVSNLAMSAELIFQAGGEGGGGRLQIWKLTLAASGGTVSLKGLDLSSLLRADETPLGVSGFYGPTADAAQVAGILPTTKLLYAQKPDGTAATVASGVTVYLTLFSVQKTRSQS